MSEMRPQTMSIPERANPARAWTVTGMLFLFMLINFADRAVLGLAAVPIMQDIELSHAQFGLIGASFFTFFSLGAVIVGFLVNHMPTKRVLAALALIWSLCQLPMLLPLSAAALIANRIALGFGEGPAYPVALHAVYKWFPREHRAAPTSFIAIGSLAGNGLVAPTIVAVIAVWSWHAAFGLLGVIGIIWCVAWLALTNEGPLVSDKVPSGERNARISYRQLLSLRTVIGVQIVGFAAYWLLSVSVVWLPAILNQSFGYTPAQAGWIIMLVALCQIMLLLTIGAFSDRLQQRGISSRLACGGTASGCTLAAGLLTIMLSQSGGLSATVLCTILAFSFGSVIFVLGPCLVAEVTPATQRGALLGINNAVVTLAGPLAPVIMGVIVDNGIDPGGGFRTALLITGSLVVMGAFAGFLLINPEVDRAAERTIPSDSVSSG
jgi:MFS transporter, ACS family, D-galactonate transporter